MSSMVFIAIYIYVPSAELLTNIWNDGLQPALISFPVIAKRSRLFSWQQFVLKRVWFTVFYSENQDRNSTSKQAGSQGGGGELGKEEES